MDTTTMLAAFGLTRQEAKLYIALHGRGAATGYELARDTGVSRSNAYASLASLADKGAASVIDGAPLRYQAVAAGEFCANQVRTLREYQARLERELVLVDDEDSPYLTIRGGKNISNKIKTIIAGTAQRIYLAMPAHILREFVPLLEEAAARKRKVVVITGSGVKIAGAIVHHSKTLTDSVRAIADSAVTLTGELNASESCSCVYSMKKNMANLIRESIRNEIRLIELQENGGAKQP